MLNFYFKHIYHNFIYEKASTLGFNVIITKHLPKERILAMDNYITLFEKFIGIIDWKLLQSYGVKLGTDYKIRSFFTHHHLASMIYFHICEHGGLRHLSQLIPLLLVCV